MTNEISLSDRAGLEAWPKAFLLLPRGEPFHNLGLISGANKLASLSRTRLNIIVGKNNKDSKDKEFL